MQDFMKGRYGVDDLTLSLGVLGMVLALIGSLASLAPLSLIALVVVVLAILRAFSKSIPARERENQMFLDLAHKIPVVGPHIGWLDREKGPRPASSASAQRPVQGSGPDFGRTKRTAERMWRERKTTLFFRCKTCGAILSVPRGKGHIRVTCPRCGTKVEKVS